MGSNLPDVINECSFIQIVLVAGCGLPVRENHSSPEQMEVPPERRHHEPERPGLRLSTRKRRSRVVEKKPQKRRENTPKFDKITSKT